MFSLCLCQSRLMGMDKIEARTLPLAVLDERRRRAVKLRERGLTLREVAAQCELSGPTVMAAHRAQVSGVWAAVAVKSRGRKAGDGRQLSAEQEAMIRRLIWDRTPDQLKLGFALWNRRAVAQLVQAQLGVQVPVRTIGHYLERWGFTPQKPIEKAQQPRPAEVQRWLEETWPRIARRAKAEGAEIHWGDEAGVRWDEVRGRGCAPKEQTPVVGANNQGDALRIISTMTNRGKVRWKVFEGAMHAGLLIDFSKWLIKDADRKVVLILDNLKVHPALTVKTWLADCEEQIEVLCLPGAQLRSRTAPRRTAEWRTDGNAD